MPGAMTTDKTGIVIFRTAHDDHTKDHVDERLIIVYEDDIDLVESISRMVKWSVREERRGTSSEFLNANHSYDYRRERRITINPMGPFAYATFYCEDPWMPYYKDAHQRYAAFCEVFGTWDEAEQWCKDRQAKAHSASLRSDFGRREAETHFHEIRKIPILGVRNGQAKAAQFRSSEPQSGKYQVCRIVARKKIIEA